MTSSETDQANYLEGQLLVAMPGMSDPRFERSVIYLCAHSAEGAMGIVINQLVESLSFPDLLQQLSIDSSNADETIRVHFGGPVETGRGFVLHSSEYLQESSLRIREEVALTATVDILKDMANGQGPQHSLLAIGYAGWGPGQLDEELQANGWLTVDPDPDLIFQPDLEEKWNKAIGKLGFDVSKLSGAAGHA
ncbi:YqgE/AlgH family protein [Fodinicurvata sediminis]|uniref:YqgE/AlgH family protein n=1 Tax=Fodinicurvata sediminis TaxID=1121832 RepID=UPI0003B5028F|nr:YqgE/AlgH family protein [Fodinicurvata sediminis]